MSVVNKMLKDLDRRQGGDPAVFTQHLHPGSGSPAWVKITMGLGLVVIAVLVVAVYLLMSSSPESVTAQAPTPIVAVATPLAPEPVSAPIESATTVATVAPEPVVVPEPPPAPRPPVARKAVVENPTAKTEAPAPVQKKATPAPTTSPAAQAPAPIPAPAPLVAESQAPANRPVLSGPTRIDMRRSAAAGISAEGEFNRAVAFINQGRAEDARTALGEALKLDANHQGARQTLAVLLVEAGNAEAAETLLAEGLRINPQASNFAVLAARLRLERGDTAGALNLLRQHGAAATGNAEYRGFTAALLQRMGNHTEAIEEYRAALGISPAVGVWWIGLGISYEANGQSREALDAFKRAQMTGTLSIELAQFVERKLQTLR